MKEYLINRNDTLAFPVPNMNTGEKQAGIQLPVDLRDYFAAKAMQVILKDQYEDGIYVGDLDNDSEDICARSAYMMADAMMAARSAT